MKAKKVCSKHRKERALDMAVTTLKEYKARKHEAYCDKCALCKSTVSRSKPVNLFTVDCSKCIMYPFGRVGCKKRLCTAVTTNEYCSENSIEIVTRFWEKVVAKIKRTPEEKFVKDWYKSDWWSKSLRTFDRNASGKLIPVY